MTSVRQRLVRRFGLALIVLLSGQVGASAATHTSPSRKTHRASAPAAKPRPPAPAYIRDRIAALGRAFDGRAGIAIISLSDRWEVDWNANSLFPQQSCSKLWVAITTMDSVDRGRVSLDDRVTLTRNDLTLFHQPLRAQVLANGSYTTTLGSLLFQAITESDNTANDKLMRSVGGPPAVRAMIARKGLGAIRFYNGERALQSRTAGLAWKQSYAIGNGFETARSALPPSVRKAAFDRYLASPYDGASPHAIASALAALRKGELLKPATTARLLSIMGQTRTGKLRVRAALEPGWDWNHKTGTGQDFGGRIGGINDIGLLTAPDGSVYAMAIMVVPNNPDGSAQNLMQAVAKTVMAQHAMRMAQR